MSKAIDPRDYVVTADTEISPIDLDREEFTLRGGRRLTEALAKELADEARAEIRRGNLIPGRKSLSASGQHSPVIHVRVPEQLHERAERRAAAEGVSLSKLAREALEAYLAS
jgi:predicted HicB family RNase H-like nuclease